MPTIVERTSSRAPRAAGPPTMPASSNASTIEAEERGTRPASAVAASNSRSSSGTTVPSSENAREHRLLGGGVGEPPRREHERPAPTRTPTLGMKRNTGTSSSRIVSSVAVRRPPPPTRSPCSGVMRSDTSRSTRSTSIGFTHRTTMSAARTRSALASTWRAPCRSARRGGTAGAAVGHEDPLRHRRDRHAPSRRPSPRPCCPPRAGR